jgi:hypothetical protein
MHLIARKFSVAHARFASLVNQRLGVVQWENMSLTNFLAKSVH